MNKARPIETLKKMCETYSSVSLVNNGKLREFQKIMDDAQEKKLKKDKIRPLFTGETVEMYLGKER